MFGGRFVILATPRGYVPAALLVLLYACPLVARSTFLQHLLILMFIYASVATAWGILGGFVGQYSIGHSMFFGIGAYTATLLLVKLGVPTVVGIWAGVALAIVLACVIGYPCLRLRGPFFSLATIAVAEVLRLLVMSWRSLTEGSMGLFIPSRPTWMNLMFADRMAFLYVALTFMVICVTISLFIARSRLGHQMRCTREDPDAAEAIGINTTFIKLSALVISASMTAIGGVLFAQYLLFIDPDSVFSIEFSIYVAMMAIIGGMAHPIGPAVGALLLTPIQETLHGWLGGSYQGLYGVVYGTMLIVIVMTLPGGIIGWLVVGYRRLLEILPAFPVGHRDAPGAKPASPLVSMQAVRESDGPILEVSGVSKRFGGLVAVNDLSMAIRRREIVGLIGPNGSGKTTLFNVITGALTLSEGEIILAGVRLPKTRAPHVAAKLGVARTFQLVRPFNQLSVFDNVVGAALMATDSAIQASETASQVLDSLGLGHLQEKQARELSLGDRKRLEIARALATHPKILLLDEVMSGLTPQEVDVMLSVIRDIQAGGMTILLVEHLIHAIIKVADRIVVLQHGEKIADGTPQAVVNDARVVEAYLGKRYRKAQSLATA